MVIEIVPQNLEISDRFRAQTIEKFTAAIGKYLNGIEEDLKIATITLEKMPRFGYSLKFDMQLPWAHIYAQQNSPLLFVGLTQLKQRVARQVREEAEKMKEKKNKG
ncbi:hypothetical protein HYZ70_02370 [Candidatus Curtissbacteria bacterium]|nr:hypothetical protein [Candidatus Curtissbacteria bacterium]